MAQDDQIPDDVFELDLEAYRTMPSSVGRKVSAAISQLRKHHQIRQALHMAVTQLLTQEGVMGPDGFVSVTDDGAQEYDDILAGQKIYQETQEG